MKALWLCLLLGACAATPAPALPEQILAPVTEEKPPIPSADAENSKKLNESIGKANKSIKDFRDKQKPSPKP